MSDAGVENLELLCTSGRRSCPRRTRAKRNRRFCRTLRSVGGRTVCVPLRCSPRQPAASPYADTGRSVGSFGICALAGHLVSVLDVAAFLELVPSRAQDVASLLSGRQRRWPRVGVVPSACFGLDLPATSVFCRGPACMVQWGRLPPSKPSGF